MDEHISIKNEQNSLAELTEVKQPLRFDLEASIQQTTESKRKRRDSREAPLVINAIYTQYEVLKEVSDE